MVGRRLLHFEILAKLGEGGMGVVYQARDTHLDRLVAIKVLPAEKVADPERRRRFVQEARAASALNHAHIITVHDITQAEGLDFIVMEYLEGKTLDALIPRAGMRLSEVLRLGVQVAQALAAAHAKGIVHRDLKPANVMVAQDGTVKVLDFGLAKLKERGEAPAGAPGAEAPGLHGDTAPTRSAPLTSEGTVVGTAAYMSPEQAEGRPVDARSDIFSFGAVLYELATGRRAFTGDSWASTISAVLSQEPKPLEGIPHDLERTILRCLRKDPAKRFQHMDDVCVALQELKEESDSGTLGDAAAAPVPRSRVARRLAYGAVSLIVLGAVAALAWRWAVSRDQPAPMKLVPLTSYPGSELYPSLSPDGQQVAFSWDGEQEDNADIYVKLVGESSALRLTKDAAREVWPAWSPDGKRIAFRRLGPGTSAIWLTSPLGGAEQKLTDLHTIGQVSWSPDGRWLASSIPSVSGGEPGGTVLVPTDGSEPRRLSRREAPAFDIHPAFSPDGRALAFASCAIQTDCDVFVQSIDGDGAPRGDPRRITSQRLIVNGLAWTRDGVSLIYGGSFDWGLVYRLWRVASSGRQPPESIDLAGFYAAAPSNAPAGGRIAFQKSALDYDVWRFQLGAEPKPFLRSSLVDAEGQFSPDGARIVFDSERGGDAAGLWIVSADGSNPRQLTRGTGRTQGSPRWSPDGRLIAFDSLQPNGQTKIFVVDADGVRPRRISAETANEYNPSWSRDGTRLYYCSNRTGRHEVWRTSLDGSTAEQVTDNGGYQALESADGRTLFYTKNAAGSALFARPVEGGPERQVLDFVTRNAFAVFKDGIYYIGRPGEDKQFPIQFYEFSTGASRLLTKVRGPFLQHLSVSPDRKTILFSMTATTGSDLMLLEHFR